MGDRHHVPLRLGVVALALDPKVGAALVHELPLLPVHHLEGVRPAPLLRLEERGIC